MKTYNPWQTLEYNALYGHIKPRAKVTHWCVFYKDKPVTLPASYAICQEQLKSLKMQGKLYDKTLLKIKPYNY